LSFSLPVDTGHSAMNDITEKFGRVPADNKVKLRGTCSTREKITPLTEGVNAIHFVLVQIQLALLRCQMQLLQRKGIGRMEL